MDFEWRVRRVDGRFTWVRSRATALLGEDGKVLRYYGSTEDIDEFKQMEEALQKCQAMLERSGNGSASEILDTLIHRL